MASRRVRPSIDCARPRAAISRTVTRELTALDDSALAGALDSVAGEIHASSIQLTALDGYTAGALVRDEIAARAMSSGPTLPLECERHGPDGDIRIAGGRDSTGRNSPSIVCHRHKAAAGIFAASCSAWIGRRWRAGSWVPGADTRPADWRSTSGSEAKKLLEPARARLRRLQNRTVGRLTQV